MKLRLAGLLLLGCAATACAARIPLINGPLTPAAEGTIAATADDNGNLRLHVEVHHLAPPERVASGAQVYVVWVAPGAGPPQNAGALTVDSDLTGKLDTTTPQRAFDLFITAEPMTTAAAPSGPSVLSASVVR